MCDKGLIETFPDVMKLEGLIAIFPELQKEIVDGISALVGEPVRITKPIAGEYPTAGMHDIRIETVADHKFESTVVNFRLQELPGCCGILVSYNTAVYPKYRGKGVNSFLQGIKEKIAEANGYTVLVATTRADNAAEIHILEKYGWVRSYDFVNNRTRNPVVFYIKNLTEKEK